jgi:hypothetical protein
VYGREFSGRNIYLAYWDNFHVDLIYVHHGNSHQSFFSHFPDLYLTLPSGWKVPLSGTLTLGRTELLFQLQNEKKISRNSLTLQCGVAGPEALLYLENVWFLPKKNLRNLGWKKYYYSRRWANNRSRGRIDFITGRIILYSTISTILQINRYSELKLSFILRVQ